MSADGYRFRLLELTDAELRRNSELLQTVFRGAGHLSPPYLRWQYIDNPDGRAIGCNAFLGDELVGHMTAVPMLGSLEGETVRGLFMLNGAVHPAHQRRRIQSRISAAIFEEAVKRGYSFCFGTGNRYSTGPLLTRFRMVRPLEARIGFGSPARRTADITPSFERVWSEEALRWRLSNPERRYAVRTRPSAMSVIA
ncbi:GNAT family N-acetyltransferase, partial [Allosphingosinicella sp.]|uniref:GNAT family N-acetyltransferase n=1 Tax=Allosphingosinicella sp. TaxID=2823234 RepID=UPI002EFD0968